MFNSLVGTQTPNVQVWDFSRAGYATSPNISLEDDCAPNQYIAVGGVSAVNINLYLPTNPPNGKTITIRCDMYGAALSQRVNIYDSSNRNSTIVLTLAPAQTVQLCYIGQQSLLGTAVGFTTPISSNWVMMIGPGPQSAITQYSETQGHNNQNYNYGAIISGGISNANSAGYGTIGGGLSNSNSGGYGTVGGGTANSNSGGYGTVGGGNANNNASGYGVIAGGNSNSTSSTSNYGTIVGGVSNSTNSWASAWNPGTSFIGGGSGNQIWGSYSSSGAVTGSSAVIVGGISNRVSANSDANSGFAAFIGAGYANTITNGLGHVIPGGYVNNISGGNYNSIIGGSYNSIAGGSASSILGGYYGTTRGITGIAVFPGYPSIVAALGASQASLLILSKQTTDATTAVLTSDGGAAGTTNQLILPNNSAFYFKGRVIATVTGGSDTKAWVFEGVIKRGAAVANTSIVGSISNNVIAQDTNTASWLLTLSADTVNGGLTVSIRGAAGVTIRWAGKIETDEVTF